MRPFLMPMFNFLVVDLGQFMRVSSFMVIFKWIHCLLESSLGIAAWNLALKPYT